MTILKFLHNAAIGKWSYEIFCLEIVLWDTLLFIQLIQSLNNSISLVHCCLSKLVEAAGDGASMMYSAVAIMTTRVNEYANRGEKFIRTPPF